MTSFNMQVEGVHMRVEGRCGRREGLGVRNDSFGVRVKMIRVRAEGCGKLVEAAVRGSCRRSRVAAPGCSGVDL